MATTFKPVNVTSEHLNEIPYSDGQFIAVTDSGDIYIDLNNERTKYGGSNSSGSNTGTGDSSVIGDIHNALTAILAENTINIESSSDLEKIIEDLEVIINE